MWRFAQWHLKLICQDVWSAISNAGDADGKERIEFSEVLDIKTLLKFNSDRFVGLGVGVTAV